MCVEAHDISVQKRKEFPKLYIAEDDRVKGFPSLLHMIGIEQQCAIADIALQCVYIIVHR